MVRKRPSISSRSSRKSKNWSSSMVGTHHRNSGSYSTRTGTNSSFRQNNYSSRRRSTSLNGRIGEVNQVRPNVREMDRRTASMNTRRSRTQEFMKTRRRNSIISIVVVIALVLVVAFSLGSCAYKGSLSSNMAIGDSEVTDNLTTANSDEAYYVLLSGISNLDQSNESLEYLAIMRVDKANNKLSLIDIPTNLAVSTTSNSNSMYKDLVKSEGEGSLIKHVSEKFGIEINHYIRMTDKGFTSLVDKFGGLQVNVSQRIDDPEVSSEVIMTGDQKLSGNSALTFVLASNYNDGFTTKAKNQAQALSFLLDSITGKSGIDYLTCLDGLSNVIKTDLNVEGLEEILSVYSNTETFYQAAAPYTQSVVNDETYAYISSSKWSQMSSKFTSGEDPTISVDTSGVNKSGLSIIVLNGSGVDGFAAQVANVLTGKGYNIQETGNADSAVYEETLVIYKDNQAAAEAIVEDLGAGRAVSAGVYYSLSTDIQIMVGKDWKPVN